MIDYIVTVVILFIISISISYIMKAKKKGVKCIGCPAQGKCASKNTNCSGCKNCNG